VITTITFQVTQFGRGTVSIYNVQGQLVRRLVDQPFAPGIHQVTWDGRDEIGHDVAAGTYLYRLQMANDVHTRKLILVR
jgi:flagellar hook assembly protein FlgD